MRWSLVIAALGLAAPAAAQMQEVTLEEAVSRALTVQPAMVQARGDAANADMQKRASYGAFLPSLTANSSAFRLSQASIVNGFPAAEGAYQFNSSLSVSLDLFSGFRRLARYSSAGANQDAAEAGVVNQRFQVALQTKQLFYDALAREELLRVAQAQVRRAQQQLQISVEKLRAGSATRSDSLRSTVEYGNARIAVLRAQANLAAAQANLGRQIGNEMPVRAVPDTALAGLPDTVTLRAEVLRGAPQLQQAEAQARAAGSGVWDARAAYFPTLGASLSTSSQGLAEPWTGFDGNRNQNQLRFFLSWTIFNGFQREQTNTQALVQRDVARARAADTRRQVNAQLTQQIAALATAFEQIEIARANVAAATEDLRVQSERYRVGAATILDLLTSQTALTTAEKDLVQARFDYLLARAELEALLGRAL